ncbi:hypothetical protein BH11PLA2_BH11PLA2_01260 [soil metagenome]
MSRAYRITVAESASREIVAADEIRSCLELLNVLPPEATAKLLSNELKARGFEETAEGPLQRVTGSVTVTVDTCSGEVRVKVAAKQDATVEAQRNVISWDDVGESGTQTENATREQMKKDLQQKLDKQSEKLQADVSAELERALAELQPELNAIANKVTRDALKAKAATLGSIQSVHENEADGTLTITLEV